MADKKYIVERKDKIIGVLCFVYSLILLFIIVDLFGESCSQYGLSGFASTAEQFTTLSNVIFMVWMCLFSLTCFFPNKLKKLKSFVTNILVTTSVLVYLTVTFLTVVFNLTPIWKGEWWKNLEDQTFFTHLISPILCLIVYILIPSSPFKTNWKQLILVNVFPVLYVILVLIVGYTGFTYPGTGPGTDVKAQHFPYAFVDPHTYGSGAKGIVIYLAVVFVLFGVFYAISFGYYNLKNYMFNLKNKKTA